MSTDAEHPVPGRSARIDPLRVRSQEEAVVLEGFVKREHGVLCR